MDKEQDKATAVHRYQIAFGFKGGVKDLFLSFKSNEISLKGFSSTDG